MSDDGKIRIRMDGNRAHTEIAMVASDGSVTPLGVCGVEFSAFSSPERTTLRLTANYGDILELDIPMTGAAVAVVKHIARDVTSEQVAEVRGRAAKALNEALAEIGIDGLDDATLHRLVIAAQMRDVAP